MRQEEYPHTYGFLSFVASLVAALAFAIKLGGRVVGRGDKWDWWDEPLDLGSEPLGRKNDAPSSLYFGQGCSWLLVGAVVGFWSGL